MDIGRTPWRGGGGYTSPPLPIPTLGPHPPNNPHPQPHCHAPVAGLDMTIEPNGQNLSVGQRQLVCMVRALLCDCKILLLDEATASVDHHTDRLIQATLRDLKGVTTLTIAHRINTILESDRVLVMDDGKAIEFDNPQALIARPGSVFGDIVAQYQADHDASNSSPRSP